MKLNIKITEGDLEVRLCDGDINKVEIVKWSSTEPRYCYMLAMFRRDKEGYNLEFVGDRPFRADVNYEDFWQLTHMAQVILDEFFSKNKTD